MTQQIKDFIDTLNQEQLLKMREELKEEIARLKKSDDIEIKKEFFPKYEKELSYLVQKLFEDDIENIRYDIETEYACEIVNEANFLYKDMKNIYGVTKVERPMIEDGDQFHSFVLTLNNGKLLITYLKMPFSTADIYITGVYIMATATAN